MLALVLLMGVASAGGADVELECASAGPPRLWLAPVAEEPGRYRVRHCRPAAAARSACQWDLTLKVLDQPPENCSYSRLGERPNGQLHSQSLLDFTPDLNCSYICLAQNMDLLFHGCYSIQSKVKVGRFSSEPYNTYHYVDNDLTPEYFHNSTHSYKPFDHEDMVSFIWETKIPITDYEVTMCKQSNDTEEEACAAVRCSRGARGGAHRLACGLRARGCRRLTLRHRAPWASGLFRRLALVHGDFCNGGAAVGVAAGGAAGGGGALRWAWAAAGACALAALLLLLLLRAGRARRRRRLKQRVLLHWRDRPAADAADAAGAAGALAGVLLLYARDCAALQRFAAALAELLRARLRVKVWDLYSPEAVSLSGAAPAAWVRALQAQPRLRTVLLQTPALRLLHPAPGPAPAAGHAPRGVALPAPTVEHFMAPLSYCLLADLCNHSWVPECGRDYRQPAVVRTFRDECDLLEYNCDYDRAEAAGAAGAAGGRRVVARRPHCGDALLALGVRALQAPGAPAYRRHYLATISSLETEALHDVVPYRRYVLPGAAEALVRDLAPPRAGGPGAPPDADGAPPAGGEAPPDAALCELRAAHAALLDYVRNNPDYLSQELMYI